MTDTSEDLWGALNSFTPLEEIGRHKVGSERFTVISLFIDGKISAAEGINLLGIGKQYFYKLVARSRGARNYNKLVPGKRGRKSGSDKLDARVEAIIDKAFDDYYYGISASYAKVWSVCQSEADAQKVVRPSYYTVRRRIKSKPPRLLYERKYGKDAAEQRYGARPGHKKPTAHSNGFNSITPSWTYCWSTKMTAKSLLAGLGSVWQFVSIQGWFLGSICLYCHRAL